MAGHVTALEALGELLTTVPDVPDGPAGIQVDRGDPGERKLNWGKKSRLWT